MTNKTAFAARILLCAAMGISLPLEKTDAAPAREMWSDSLKNGDFQAGTSEWSVHTKEAQAVAANLDEERTYNGRPALSLTTEPNAGRLSIYQTVPVEGGRLYEVRIVYAIDPSAPSESAKEGDLEVKLAFNRENSGNGSAGVERFLLPAGKAGQWNEISRFVYIPEDAELCQFVVTLVGGAKSAWLGETGFRAEGAHPVSLVTRSLLPTDADTEAAWAEVASLEGFWQVGKAATPAVLGTEVKVAYDKTNLYLRMRNAEPHLAELKEKATVRDDKATYFDDCNELFIAVSDGVVRQFITNSGGVQWDGALYQKAAGDPFRPDPGWNGDWKARIIKGTDEWTSYWTIPWSDLGVKPSSGLALKINIGRQRQTGAKEISQWNYFDGGFNTVDKFAILTFSDEGAELVRTVEPIADDLLKISRDTVRYEQLLSNQPGGYLVGDWAYAYYLASYPAPFRARYTADTWQSEQRVVLEEMGRHGLFGPAIPWVSQIGWATLEEMNERWGMKFPVFMGSSSVNRVAKEAGARFVCPRSGTVSDFDPEKLKAMEAFVRNYFERNPEGKPMVLAMKGTDEPTNTMFSIFSRTLRPHDTAILDEVEKEIREFDSGGKHGLYDFYDPAAASAPEAPFQRIAFNHWWNRKMGEAAGAIRKFVKEIAPDVPLQAFQHNSVSGMTQGDISVLGRETDWVSVDPYPTATLRFYGRARALYHTGFSTKFAHDLSGGKTTQTIAQGFEYHGRAPGAEEVREWASQALKNGASVVNWYTAGPSRYKLPEMYAEILAVSKQIHEMNKLELPDDERTAILFSISSQAGMDDPVLHSAYSVYALLGEKTGSWFRFISETDIAHHPNRLSAAELIYLPQATYFSRSAAEALLKRVEQGATLVVFDPQAFILSDNGSDLSDIRMALIGTLPGERVEAGSMITETGPLSSVEKGWELPLMPTANISSYKGVQAFETVLPKDASLFATYGDGRPAAFLRPVGKGKVLYFGAQPFGDSSLAVADSRWPDVFRALAKQAGTPTDLPIWDFYLKRNP